MKKQQVADLNIKKEKVIFIIMQRIKNLQAYEKLRS